MKIDIYSGFLGAGKTTLIKKMISEAYSGEKLMLIENEFGQIGIDGGFLKESGINITEMNSGCICCSLVGDFSKALKEAIDTYHPERIIIEPSGVGKLSDVIKATEAVLNEDVKLNGLTTVVDVNKCKMYMKNFGEFFNNQIEVAKCIILSHTGNAGEKKIAECVALIRDKNSTATIIATDWDKLTGAQILDAIEHTTTLENTIEELMHHHEHHHHHEHDEHCECGCHDHHEHHEHHEHEHHEHHHHLEHDEHCDCGCHDHHEHKHEHHEHEHHEHHHHLEHDEHCECGCHDHHEHGHEHHHHHHADEVFASWGIETAKKFSNEEIKNALDMLSNEEKYGIILRAKGIVDSNDGDWIYFDYIPGAIDIRRGNADVIGKLCVIGSDICEHSLKELFNV